MKQNWTIEQSAQTYAIENWGDGYFSINDKGHVCVKPSSEQAAGCTRRPRQHAGCVFVD